MRTVSIVEQKANSLWNNHLISKIRFKKEKAAPLIRLIYQRFLSKFTCGLNPLMLLSYLVFFLYLLSWWLFFTINCISNVFVWYSFNRNWPKKNEKKIISTSTALKTLGNLRLPEKQTHPENVVEHMYVA